MTDDCEQAESFNGVFASKFLAPLVDRLPEVTLYDIDALNEFCVMRDAVFGLLMT